MNLYIKEQYNNLTPEGMARYFASFLQEMGTMDNQCYHKECIKKFIRKEVDDGGWLSGEHVIKYLLRSMENFADNQTLTDYKSNRNDPLEVSKYSVFSGSFAFEKDLGGFVPVMKTIECTKRRSDYYKERKERDILTKWDVAKSFLRSPSGHAASLIYSFEEQHVYFMRNTTTEEIKIGISLHPEVRRKQIQAVEREGVEILHIINGGGRDLEKSLHDKFKKYHTRGEWFKPEKSLLDYIDGYKETLRVAA